MRLSPVSMFVMAFPTALLLSACDRGMPAAETPPATPSAVAATSDHGMGVHVMQAWLRATPPGATVGAGYGVLHNPSDAAATLVGVESPAAARVEIHEMREVEGMMQMREVTTGLAVGPGEQLTLAPGGLHLMLIDLAAPLAEGDAVPMTFRFANGEALHLTVPVRRDAAGSDEDPHAHH